MNYHDKWLLSEEVCDCELFVTCIGLLLVLRLFSNLNSHPCMVALVCFCQKTDLLTYCCIKMLSMPGVKEHQSKSLGNGSAEDIKLSSEGINSRIAIWKQVEQQHKQKQLINPFSQWEGASHREKLSIDDKEYARPVEGSMTAIRGQMAGERISGEIQTLMCNIKLIGSIDRNGHYSVRFGKLFNHYVKISNKLVGILMRARKQGLLDFEGEMLWQRRDDNVVITLLESG